MTMKLPIILSAMIAALAVPGALASSEANEATKAEGAMESKEGAMESKEGAMEAKEEGKESAMEEKKESKGKKKKHHHHAKHKHGHHKRGPGHKPDEYDQPWDYIKKGDDSSGCDGSSSSDGGKKLPEEVPGQKGPQVPAGQ